MMVHPAPVDIFEQPFSPERIRRPLHRQGGPRLGLSRAGINAADALTVAQTAIGLLRQHISPPTASTASSPRRRRGERGAGAHLRELHGPRPLARPTGRDRRQSLRCFDAGALATGATVRYVTGRPYAEMHHDAEMAQLYRRNAERLAASSRTWAGRARARARRTWATYRCLPSIHPMIGIASLPAVNHQPEFAAHCATPDADQALTKGHWRWPGPPSTWRAIRPWPRA